MHSEPGSDARQIDARIAELGDWRGDTLARVRALIRRAVPEVVEELKWHKPSNGMAGVPAWSHHGLICTGETYRDKVKLTFARGASLRDPAGLFNASLGGKVRRAIDLAEGDAIDERAFMALVRAAAAANEAAGSTKSGGRPAAAKGGTPADTGKPKLLAGGNPQIPKGDGDAPVQAYIAAMPGWKQEIGRRLDALVARTVPEVRKAVRWNSPFYGLEDRGWFLSFHCFTRYVKVTFFRGSSLRPVPPVVSKHEDVRHLHVHEDDPLDEQLVESWVRQAAALPGWTP